jgi:hypothetical protein
MKKLIFLILCISFLYSQEIIPGNKVDIEIKVKISVDTIIQGDTTIEEFKFEYKLKSLPTSQQPLWAFAIPLKLKNVSDTGRIKEVSAPGSWWDRDPRFPRFGLWGNWLGFAPWDSIEFLQPGDSLSGFYIKTTLFPDVGDAYVEGDHPLPSFPEGHVPDSIPGYDDLTPYGPGKVYKTVVLGKEPSMGSSNGNYPDSAFRDLRHKLAECEFEGWISNKIYWDLRRVIDRAWDFIKDGRLEQSKRTLTHLLRTLKRLKEQKIKDEAFYVMFYRTKYVRDNLWYKPPGK